MASRDPLVRAQLDVALLRKSLRDIATMAEKASGLDVIGRMRQEALSSEVAYVRRVEERKAKDLTPLSEKEKLRAKWEPTSSNTQF